MHESGIEKANGPMNIRPTTSEDLPALRHILNETGLFPVEMLPELLENFLSDRPSADRWLSCAYQGTVIGFCYAVAEQRKHPVSTAAS